MEYPSYAKMVGRSYEQVNCWDLVREFYLKMFNVELKSYYDGPTPDREEIKNLIYTNVGEFERVEGEPKFGDIVLIKLYGIESHIGVVVKDGSFLHSVKVTGSVIDKLEKYKNMIVGFYRLKGIQ